MKRPILFFFALLLTGAANLRLCCRLELDGRQLGGLYSLRSAAAGERTAQRAAEEIMPGDAETPRFTRRYCLSLSHPSSDVSVLTDALLCATPGISSACEVRANGERLGCVESRAILLERLHEYLYTRLPDGVSAACLDCTMDLDGVYTRSALVGGYCEMLERITGAVPVIYTLDWAQSA